MDEKYLVTKSNYLINAKYMLTLEQQRIIRALVSLIQPDDNDFKNITIKVTEFMKLINVKSNKKYEDLKRATKKLVSKLILINYIEDGKWVQLQTTWLASAKYKDGKIDFEFSTQLKPYLIGLKEFFTTYQLINVLSLKSQYSVRIYEILKSYQRKKKYEVSLDELRDKFELGDKYKKFSDFRKKVLDYPQAELKEKTDISYTYDVIKTNSSNISIRFNITQNKEDFKEGQRYDYNLEDVQEISQKVKNLTGCNIAYKKVCELLEEKGIDFINLYLDNYHKFKANKHNPVGFLIKAILEEYPIPEEEVNNYDQKPAQSTNFEQRVYDDEYFDNLYDNLRDVKNE